MTNMLIKQSIKSFGVEKTMASCKVEMKQIHMQNSFIPKHYYHELTPKQKSRMVGLFMFLKEKKDRKLKSQEVIGGNVQRAYFYGVISTVQWRDRTVRAPEKVRGQVLSFPAKIALENSLLASLLPSASK